MWSWLLETMFPSRCIVCARRGTALCLGCRERLPYMPAGVCRRCATVLGSRGACRGCRYLSPSLSWVRAPFAYTGAARRAVLTLKFRSGRYLVPIMGEFLRTVPRPPTVDMVVPVPLSSGRRRARGFNQAALLAAELVAGTNAVLAEDVLSRTERTAQSRLRAADRLTNLQGVFHCRSPGAVKGREILLVDDVITTGATVSACADTLADAGAARVCALAFARDL